MDWRAELYTQKINDVAQQAAFYLTLRKAFTLRDLNKYYGQLKFGIVYHQLSLAVNICHINSRSSWIPCSWSTSEGC